MKIEPISKEMFDKLYNIFLRSSDRVDAFQEVVKHGLIKKTALEEARDSWHELNISKKYSFDCHTYGKIVNIVDYYEKAIEEISKDK